jgi:hypothetical protein
LVIKTASISINPGEDSPELEAELLKVTESTSRPFHKGELRKIADRALREYREDWQNEGRSSLRSK